MAIQKKDFTYKGKTSRGEKVTGIIKARNKREAQALLRQQDIVSATVQEKKKPSKFSLGKKISAMDVAAFSRQMATMQTAGIPLVQALNLIINGTEKPDMVKLIKSIKESVEGGTTLAYSLMKHPQYFDELYCNLVLSGEQSGTLDKMLARIATYKEKTESLKRKIKKAMYYPIAVLVIATVVTVLLLVKVVPTFKDLFEGFGAELPAFTLLVLKISDTLQQYGGWCFIGVVATTWIFIKSYKKNVKFKNKVQEKILKLPIFGNILHKAVIARFTRTLSTTFAAGVPLTDALVSVAKASNNIVYFRAIMQIKDNVSAGKPMYQAMATSGLFPAMVNQMVSIGEETGNLEEMLDKVANIYEEEVNLAVDGLTTLLEPLIMVILGVVVGGLVIAMYLPIFKLGSVI